MAYTVGNGPVTAAIGKDMTLAFEPTRIFPMWNSFTEMQKNIARLGVGNIVKDSHASITLDRHGDNAFDLKCEKAEDTLERLYSGDYMSGTRTSDPVESEFKRLLNAKIGEVFASKGIKKPTKEQLAIARNAVPEAYKAKLRAEAAEIVAMRKATQPMNTDLADAIAAAMV